MRNKRMLIGSAIILISFIVFLVVSYFIAKPKNYSNNDSIFVDSPVKETKGNKENEKIVVSVRGEVKNPGDYSLSKGSRIANAIEMAGGYTADADVDKVNSALLLRDEEFVMIYKKVSNTTPPGLSGGAKATVATAASAIESDGKLNINIATEKEIDDLPGVGKVTAEKIIKYREANGRYTSEADLLKSGISKTIFSKMKDKIVIR